MNWDRMEGEWKQRRGKAVRHWGKLMNDDLAAIAGRYEELVGRLQEKYGVAKEKSRQNVELFKKTVEKLKKSNKQVMELQGLLARQKKWVGTRGKTSPPTEGRRKSRPTGSRSRPR